MTDLMQGKRGLVMGVANDRSIAWGIAKALHAEGAELAFSYQGEAFGKRVEPLAASLGSSLLVDVDVMNDASMDACFATLGEAWGNIDFVVHAIAFSDKNELTGRFINTSRARPGPSDSDRCRARSPALDRVGQVHLVDMVIAARHADAVRLDHHVGLAAAFGRDETVAGQFDPSPSGSRK
jgi:NAD(P)-dependent dehydrogenase (short-subunit alcohol dehydrogenase family)